MYVQYMCTKTVNIFIMFWIAASDGGSTPVMDERSDEEDIRQDEDLEVSAVLLWNKMKI